MKAPSFHSQSARGKARELSPLVERMTGWLSEELQVDASFMNVRRGLIRVLIMAAGLFWLVAAADTLNTYRSAPPRPDGWILQTEEGSYYQVEAASGRACETVIGDIAKDFKARGMGALPADACAHREANRETLRARDGRRAALDVLGGYAIGFIVVSGFIAAAWWAARGFLPPRRRDQVGT